MLVTALAAALRLSTLDLQSFWYDEAFTAVHVLHPSLVSTLRAVVHSENTPPLWYVIAWADTRLFGTGEIALRAPSAIAGIATVPVAWAIGRELTGRWAAIACALLVAVNPLFVWYSQEARAYALFVLTAALAILCFLRLMRAEERTDARAGRRSRDVVAFTVSGVLALLSHYFAVFLLIPMVVWLAWRERSRRAGLLAGGLLALAGAALLPLISAQGGHGTQWIGRWPLGERLAAIPQYYLTGYSGAPLGHGIELLVALPILTGLGLGLWRMSAPRTRQDGASRARAAQSLQRVKLALVICACGVLIPIVLIAFGADYLAPRNLVAAMIPLTAVIAAVSVWPAPGTRGAPLAGLAAAATIALAFLAITIDVDLSPRLQRGNWRDLAKALRHAPAERVLTTVELGSAPLEYYLPGLHELRRGAAVRVREIDETGYAPLRASAARPPAPGFRLLARLDVDGLFAYRFVSGVPRLVSEAALRRHVITADAPPEVLVPGSRVQAWRASFVGLGALLQRARPSVAARAKDLGFRHA